MRRSAVNGTPRSVSVPLRSTMAPAQLEAAVLPLGKNGAHAQSPPHLMPDDDAPERGREHDRNAERPNEVSDSRAEEARTLRILQNERALEIP